MPNAKSYPLVFAFHEVIVGKGFAARVELYGRALLESEDSGTWIYGVQPGAISGGGCDYQGACREFKKSFLSVAFDVAEEAASFDEFKAELRQSLWAVNEPNDVAWNDALSRVRRGKISLDGLPSVKAEAHEPRLEIELLRQETMSPQVNQFDELAKAA